jgi:hypothetical protein
MGEDIGMKPAEVKKLRRALAAGRAKIPKQFFLK